MVRVSIPKNKYAIAKCIVIVIFFVYFISFLRLAARSLRNGPVKENAATLHVFRNYHREKQRGQSTYKHKYRLSKSAVRTKKNKKNSHQMRLKAPTFSPCVHGVTSGVQYFQIKDWREACHIPTTRDSNVRDRFVCFDISNTTHPAAFQNSAGNMLVALYTGLLVLPPDVKFAANTGSSTSLAAAYVGKSDNAIQVSNRRACNWCLKSYYPHMCHALGLHSAIPTIRADMKLLARNWRVSNRRELLDDVVIHVRCGDTLDLSRWAATLKADMDRLHKMYRQRTFAPYWLYKAHMPSDVKRIGIISASLDPTECRAQDCPHIAECTAVVHDLKSFLSDTYADATVTIHAGDSQQSDFARIVLAKVAICNPSSYCLIPTLGTTGRGIFVQTHMDRPLYPWLEHINDEDIVIEFTNFSFAESKERQFSIANILGMLRLERQRWYKWTATLWDEKNRSLF